MGSLIPRFLPLYSSHQVEVGRESTSNSGTFSSSCSKSSDCRTLLQGWVRQARSEEALDAMLSIVDGEEDWIEVRVLFFRV